MVRVSPSRSRGAARHPDCYLGAGAESEFGENAFDVAFGGPLGDDQSLGNLTIRQAAFDQLGHLEVSFGQWRSNIGAPGCAPIVTDTEHEIDHVVKITQPMRDATLIGSPRRMLLRMTFREPRQLGSERSEGCA